MKISPIALEITSIFNKIFEGKNKPIALHEPLFQGNEWKYVKECLDSGWVSSLGQYVDKFELMLAEFTGVKRAVVVVNGTAALHIGLLLAGVKENDEVMTPTLSFVATANAISYCKAIPHFIDSSYHTLGVDPKKLNNYLKQIVIIKNKTAINKKTNRRISCLVVMHTFGHPVEIEKIKEICDNYHITLIEDAAESLGSYYKEIHTGYWGKLSILSFNGNKTISTGGGGAILTNDVNLANLAKHITTTAKIPHPWNFYHDQVAYNYRMPNINAALGVAQIEQLPSLLEKKKTLASIYKQAFKNVRGISFFNEPSNCKSNYWLNLIMLDKDLAQYRDDVLKITNESGFLTRPCWTLMHKLPMYKQCPRMDVSQAEDIESRVINIPSSPSLV